MYRGPVPKNFPFNRAEECHFNCYSGVLVLSMFRSLYRGGEFVIYYLVPPPPRLFTVPYFPVKIVAIERFALRAAILHECHNYLGGGGPSP